MIKPARIGSLLIALVLAGLLPGCVQTPSRSAQRVRSARDFEVVETSTKRTLTSREMALLRTKVADYLKQQGATSDGDYYVKVYLGEEEGVQKGDWVVVRYTPNPTVRYSTTTYYPHYAGSYHSTYAYDYYPFSDYGFGRLSFQYYDYPYYGYHYFPRTSNRPPRGHHGDRDRPDRPDHKPDQPDHRPPPVIGSRPNGALKPSFSPSANADTLWQNTPSVSDGRRREGDQVNRGESRPRGRNREATASSSTNFNPTSSSQQSGVPTSSNSGSTGALRPPRRDPVFHNSGGDRGESRYNRPERGEAPAARESAPASVRERAYTPPSENPGRSHYSSRSELHSRAERTSDYSPPPAVRSEPAPVRADPPPSYSEPAPASEPSHQREITDGGRTARER